MLKTDVGCEEDLHVERDVKKIWSQNVDVEVVHR